MSCELCYGTGRLVDNNGISGAFCPNGCEIKEDAEKKIFWRPGKGIIDCSNEKCRNFTHSEKDNYCWRCVSIANSVQDNARNKYTGERPDFVTALRIAAYCMRIMQNPYAAPEQLEWVVMIFPDVFLYFYGGNEDVEEIERMIQK